MKSIITGILIIICAIYQFTGLLIIFGAAIVGLHIGQWYIETKFIREIKESNRSQKENQSNGKRRK
jgi:hypothetical protein